MNARLIQAKVGARMLLMVLIGVAAAVQGGPAWAAPSASVWGSHYFPNVELIDQDGEKLRVYDDLLKDKVFAISFIYSRCTQSCPMETAALRSLQKALGDSAGKDVMLYSISIDGDRDNPAELKQYAAKFHAGPGWRFLTGRPEDVTLLRQKLGMYRNDGQAEQLNEHGISIVMGNERAGLWIKRSPFEETKSLLRVLTTRLQSQLPRSARQSMALAERLPPASQGEKLYRAQCEACHSLGSDEGIGPGLAGVVARRDRGWLKQWIQQPERMIAERDATAIELLQRYKNLPMPNQKLSDMEADAIIDFLAAQDTGGERVAVREADPG